MMNQSSDSHYDVAVVGAGIVGIAYAYAAAKRGLRVVIFERDPRAYGASVRNFGIVWPIGQPSGPLLERALRGRAIWGELAEGAGISVNPTGSLGLAYHVDEKALLEEFASDAASRGYSVEPLTASEVVSKYDVARSEGLLGGLWSRTEAVVDPCEALSRVPEYLSERYGVQLEFGASIVSIDCGRLRSGSRVWSADRIWICSGSDFATLYPEIFAASGLERVKLQMMRTSPQPEGFCLGSIIYGGLTMARCGSFSDLLATKALCERIRLEMPFVHERGIHGMLCQNARGELIVGDSHDTSAPLSPFIREDINQSILDYLRSLARVPDLRIRERWQGVYARLPGQSEFRFSPEPGVEIVTGLGGAGMTLAFGLAEESLSLESSKCVEWRIDE